MRKLILCALFLASCELLDAPNGVAVAQALKEACPNGGVTIHQGIDVNRNGKIDLEEVSGSETVCHGNNGANGLDGKDGRNGASTAKITMSIRCKGQLTGTSVTAIYNASLFSSGDISVSASVHGTRAENGASRMYAAMQIDAATAPVSFVYDLAGADNSGEWKVWLDRETMIMSVDYTDVDVANGKLTWQLTPPDCTVGDY